MIAVYYNANDLTCTALSWYVMTYDSTAFELVCITANWWVKVRALKVPISLCHIRRHYPISGPSWCKEHDQWQKHLCSQSRDNPGGSQISSTELLWRADLKRWGPDHIPGSGWTRMVEGKITLKGSTATKSLIYNFNIYKITIKSNLAISLCRLEIMLFFLCFFKLLSAFSGKPCILLYIYSFYISMYLPVGCSLVPDLILFMVFYLSGLSIVTQYWFLLIFYWYFMYW